MWAKPLSDPTQAPATQKAAALVFNGLGKGSYAADIDFSEIPGLSPGPLRFAVRDVWNRKDLGTFTGKYTTGKIDSHDSVLLTFTTA